MKSKASVFLFFIFIAIQAWGIKSHLLTSGCKLGVGYPATIEAGDSTYLEVNAYDSISYSYVPISSVSWAPSSSVLYPTAAGTYVKPTVTTTYTVTVSTPCGIISDTITIYIGCSMMGYASSSPYYCSSDEGTAYVYMYQGQAPYTYLWSNGQTTSSASGLSAGTYSVSVKDAYGCNFIDSSIVYKSTPSISSAITIEPGDTIELSVWGGDATTYSWAPSSSILYSGYGNVSVFPKTNTTYTVTTNGPCGTWTDTVTVFIGCPNFGFVPTITPYFCSANGGTASAGFSYTTPPYTYLWNTGQTTATITGLSGGSYSVVVTDANGCSFNSTTETVDSSKVKVYNYYAPTIEAGDSALLSIGIDDSLKYGLAWDIHEGSYAYYWVPSASVTNNNTNNAYAHPKTTTTYTVTVTTPCQVLTDTEIVYVGCTLSAWVYTSPYYCSADSGTASVYISSGIPPYTYLWSNGQTTSSINGLTSGSYSVSITDSNGCNTIGLGYVYPGSYHILAYPNGQTIAPGDSIQLRVYTDTLTNFKYSWSPSASVTSPDSARTYVHPAVTTTYTVTAITPCGVLTDTVTVFVNCNHYDQAICIVTTDTSINKNVIIWGRNNSPAHGYFNLYGVSKYGWPFLIGTVADTALSEFVDNGSNPDKQSYSYRLSTVDSCGESALSPINSSIFLQVTIGVGKDSLYWTPYVGFTTPTYYIYRGLALNALTLLDSVSGSTLSYIDISPPSGSIYLVEAVNPTGSCVPTHSRITHGVYSINPNVSLSNGGIPKAPTSIEKISFENTVNVFPNPSHGSFTLKYNSAKQEKLDIKIVDAVGRIIYSKECINEAIGISTFNFNLGNIAKGFYYLVITNTQGIEVKKLIII